MNQFTVDESAREGEPSMRLPIVAGAALTVALSLIPFANLTCCLPMIFGGLLATFLYSRGLNAPMAMSKGITIGLVTTLLGGVLAVLLVDIVWVSSGYHIGAESMRNAALWLAEFAGEDAVEKVREEIAETADQKLTGATFVMELVSTATVSAVGGLISGSLGAVLFKGRSQG